MKSTRPFHFETGDSNATCCSQQWWGLLLLALGLTFDGLSGPTQEKLNTRYVRMQRALLLDCKCLVKLWLCR
jgi:hypothetical protein